MSNLFDCPSTPPRSKSRSHKLSSPPQLKYPTYSPTTPASKSNPYGTPSTSKKSANLRTPHTTKKSTTSSTSTASFSNYLRTPSTTTKKPPPRQLHTSSSQKSLRTPLLPPTPEFTPHKNQRRRKQHVEAIESASTTLSFEEPKLQQKHETKQETPKSLKSSKTHNASSQQDSFSFGVFLPTPSTVGTGRKLPLSPARNLKAPPSIDFSKMSSFNENFNYGEEEEDDTSFHDDCSITESMKNADLSQISTTDSLSIPILKESFVSPQKNHKSTSNDSIFSSPATPGHQLIDDDIIKHWHGKSYNNEFSSDEDLSDDELIPMAITLENPFIQPASEQAKPRSKSFTKVKNPFDSESSPLGGKGKIDYSTHAEYINNKTGAVRVVKLSERQMKIKPKKLSFAGFN